MSESFLTAAFLSMSGGLQDAYTYICRGEVFANAQTGNIVILSQSIVERQWSVTLRYLVPLMFFAMGIAAAEMIRQKYRNVQRIHWRQLVLMFEIVLLFIVGFLPTKWNLLANAMVSFACAMQVQTFRKVNGYAFASTMCIGNIRSGMEALCMYGKSRDKEKLHKAAYYLGIIGMFGVGAAFGGHMIHAFGIGTIWISCVLLLIGFFLMFVKEEIYEHPEIRDGEKAIREDLIHIGKEAKEVGEILKKDLK